MTKLSIVKGLKVKIAACALGFAVIAIMLFLYLSRPVFLVQLDNRIYDALLISRPKVEPSPVPVIIDIDEQALEKYGQWPWPRYRLAELIRECVEKGASSVALDILLAEPDRSSPVNIREDLLRDAGVEIDFGGLPPSYADNDLFLAETIKEMPVVLGMYVRFEGGRDEHSPALPRRVGYAERGELKNRPISSFIRHAPDAAIPLEVLHRAAPVGFFNVDPDSDGFVRKVPLLVFVDGKPYASLGLRALMLSLGQRNIKAYLGQDERFHIRLGEYDIPISPEGDFTVPFTGPRGEYDYVSAASVLDGSLPSDVFAGKILFVGTSAPGLLDIRATPYDRIYPGVEVHAATLDAIITGRSMEVPSWTYGLQILMIVFSGVVATVAFTFARPRVYVSAGMLLLAVAIGGSLYLFGQGLFVSPLYVVFTILSQGLLLLILRFWQEERQKIMIRQTFSRYVSPEVVKRITAQSGNDFFSGDERELSIMFTDIRAFTSISEKLDPRQIVSLLNRYFTPMTALVRRHGGTLDKFIGDALMAFWNAPLDVPEHPVKAVETALLMQEELNCLNLALDKDFGTTLSIGAGIHTGKGYVGNMGSEDLVNYTLIGDNVNLTSRLEGLCAVFGVKTVVSGTVRQYCEELAPGRFDFYLLDILRVKGREQPVAVYVASRPEEAAGKRGELASFQAARDIYAAGDFAGAEAAFAVLSRDYPDEKTYAVYLDRVQKLAAAPPQDWDGIWILESK